jgi:hypothetical protein
MFIGRDWIAGAGIKFRQTRRKSGTCGPDLRALTTCDPCSSAAPGQRRAQEECDRKAGQRRLTGHGAKPCQGLPGPLRGLNRRSQPIDGDAQAFGHLFDRPRDIGCRVDGTIGDARRRDGLGCFVVQGQNSDGEGRGSHLWLSARARVLNSGPEDLWLSATGAVVNGGWLPPAENAGRRILFQHFMCHQLPAIHRAYPCNPC